MRAAPEPEQTPPGANTTGRALIPFTAAPARGWPWPSLRHGILVAAFGLAAGAGVIGAGGARHVLATWTTPAQADPQAAMLRRLQGEVGRLQASLDTLRAATEAAKPDEPLRGVRHSVDALKQDIEQVRTSGAASVAQLSAKIDKADHDPSPKLAEIAARLDRIEHTAALPKAPDAAGPKLADLASRLDRIEKQVASQTPTGSITVAAAAPLSRPPIVQAIQGKPPAPAQALSLAKTDTTAVAATPPAKLAPLAGWVLRDVYDGVALVEARGGGLREVGPGEYLPGAGEVRSIERRGRSWVVLTSRGLIDDTTF